MTKEIMPTLNVNQRIHTFEEVNLGYTSQQAVSEAKRCLNCKHHPCTLGCPVGIDIPRFIGYIAESEFEKAYQVIRESSCLPAVCGRVCPQETQCEKLCVLTKKGQGVSIGHLERFVADYHLKHVKDSELPIHKRNHKVAVIGSGPAGLSCAHDLIKSGIEVDMYEALHLPGGVLTYGIPEFRLPKEIVMHEVELLKKAGVNLYTNVIIGKTLTIEDLKQMHYKAIFIGTGAGLPKFMNIPGEMYNGVYSANEFLTRVNLMKAYDQASSTPVYHAKNVAVVGGGNVALDAARSALRLGAKHVYIIYRRTKAELPSRHEEVMHAEEEGIELIYLSTIKEIYGNDKGSLNAIKCNKMVLGEPDSSGRPRPIEDPLNSFVLEVDEVIFAIGTTPNPLILQSEEKLESTKEGCLVVDPKTNQTTIPMIYAGGDVVTGSATVIQAMEAGRKAAKSITDILLS
ncbi:MAG: NADPH-dependent glutamate synthase [Acholeplasmataceae bacterium]|jgi:glutamate synthase (NADPH/NADH) small chain|nr:NADPH-dependent glutamate synthase [Acholeplasmataceae bacterium]